jgi:hypothetical protein
MAGSIDDVVGAGEVVIGDELVELLLDAPEVSAGWPPEDVQPINVKRAPTRPITATTRRYKTRTPPCASGDRTVLTPVSARYCRKCGPFATLV